MLGQKGLTFQNLSVEVGRLLSYHIQMQGKFHSHSPHNFQQPTRICNRDPTLMLTYYELDNNQNFSKTIENVESPSLPHVICFS
jgi:hypothetical protein